MEKPSIVLESYISELQAKLTKTKMDLKNAEEDAENFKQKVADGSFTDGIILSSFKRHVDGTEREKYINYENVNKLQKALAQYRGNENNAANGQVNNSLDIAEQGKPEISAVDQEVKRLKDELGRRNMTLRDSISERNERVTQERNLMESKFNEQVEQLRKELAAQWESTKKVQMEYERHRRENKDLRKELARKKALVEEIKREMHNKTCNNCP